jgi:hypothetical protein
MLNTSESIRSRTGPFVVKWFTAAEQSRQFDYLDEALEFVRPFDERQRLNLRIECATGEAMHYDEIAERLGWA